MSAFTYSRPGTNMAQPAGTVQIDTSGIEAKLDLLTAAISDNQFVIEMPELPERDEPEISVNVSPVVIARVDWEPLAAALRDWRPIVNVEPIIQVAPAAQPPISLSSSPVVMQGSPALVWGVYAIASIMACLLAVISFALYLNVL